ncbi:unnamed protein product [Schistosoma turkestanicum]|nr:unnamed protein product [Schistosoma turkestanicum]
MSFIISFYVSPWRDTKIIEVTNVRRRHQMKATRTILFLAISFLCFQTPSFILVIIQHYTKLKIEFQLAKLVSDLLLTFDSIINIMIYAVGLPGFRGYLNRMFICLCRWNHTDHDHHHNNNNNMHSNRCLLNSIALAHSEFQPISCLNRSKNSHYYYSFHGSKPHPHLNNRVDCNEPLKQLQPCDEIMPQNKSTINDDLTSIRVKEICDDI